MSEFEQALEELAQTLGDARAAAVLETSGIELAVWGSADFETVTAEVAELWKAAGSSEGLSPEPPESVVVHGPHGTWIVLPLGADYLLALLAGPDLPAGKARFYAHEWAQEHREAFA
ncbi:MAG: hypothetical protein HZB55_18305 [Deltaproteobacteria bacterium]|nr:hypothetical protein [Deltaproteobacteria bacterium]